MKPRHKRMIAIALGLAALGIASALVLSAFEKDALPWLERNGDPYRFSVYDAAGRIAIDYGVYGVPETYVIDQGGVIRHKHVGPLTPDVVQKKLEPLVKELRTRGPAPSLR